LTTPTASTGARSTITADGVALAVRWWVPPEPNGTGVVVVHGFTGSKDDDAVAAVAERLVADGRTVVSYDSRGHGASEGHCTLGNDEHHDVAAVVAILREQVPDIVVVGASMGAIGAVRFAATARADESAGIKGVVTVSGPGRWRVPRTLRSGLAALITQTSLGRRMAAGRLGVRITERWRREPPPVDIVGRLRVPLAVVHGRRDRFLLPAEAHALHDAAPEPKRLYLVQGMGHGYEDHAVPVIADAVTWALQA
jgi:pimeloyl-ACP methyl ester carboxylesterase